MTALGGGACSATHTLGPVDPGTVAQLDALAARSGTTVEVVPLPGPPELTPSYGVTVATAEGLKVSTGDGPPQLISYDRVRSLSTFDRLHGARNGALGGGLLSFGLGFIFGKEFDRGPLCDKASTTSTGGGCPPRPNTTLQGLKIGGVAALIGAAVGGSLGALAGYEDRYVLQPTETASAR
jgi:hypothetical protein